MRSRRDMLLAMPPQGCGANPNDCKVSDYNVDGNKITRAAG
jgi:hypothetical protein